MIQILLHFSSKMESFYKGMELAKMQHVAIGKEVHTSLDMGHVISAGPCLYAVIQDVISIYHLRLFPS